MKSDRCDFERGGSTSMDISKLGGSDKKQEREEGELGTERQTGRRHEIVK